MKYLTKLFWLICICATSSLAQETQQSRKIQYVEVPREIILPVIAVQPNCPIKFENVRVVAGVEGGFSDAFQMRNIGTKPIRSLTVASSAGSTNTYAREAGVLAMPGQLIPTVSEEFLKCQNCTKDEVVHLTDKLREKLGLKGEMKSVVVLMIVSVEFTDGTKYDDEKTFKAIEKLFENLQEAVEQQKQRNSKP
ncbi:MAG TPA: hypothetical protein VF648_08725 [Pyrinomonadaceae bacterium]|jgi:hypothetical protein